jgi:lysophospholipase L1-like esterase
MPHVVLIGDSIFDNAAYTSGEPDVISHLKALLPGSWQATLVAADGATTGDVSAQLERVPGDATHLVVSIGGNDALGHSDLLRTAVKSTSEALAMFASRVAQFDKDYRDALTAVLARGKPTTVCTVYNGNLEHEVADIARVALAIFNDRILQFAFERHLTTLELRQVCSEPSDYANPIEPSGRGGKKIAIAIARALGVLETDTSGAVVLTR